ncbi:hypothetical protein L3Q82_020496, partial [Scortum barcoo]
AQAERAMSWAEEDWTVGLSGRVLQKVKELQVHQERLSRENKQKQLQLDNIHTSLEKQTVKYEEVRGELQYVQRELQSVRDEAKAVVSSRERLTQELQSKQAQLCSFEGKLDAARTLNNNLTQEIKRLEAELEKLQNSSRSADTTLFSTPCWSTTSPWEHNESRKDERPGHRDEGQSRGIHSRWPDTLHLSLYLILLSSRQQRLQFSEVATASLPRQQHRNTPHRHPSDQSDTFSTPLAAFPWERDDSRPAAKRRSPPSPQTPCTDVVSPGQSEQGVCGKEKDHRKETDICLAEMQSRVSALEEELRAKAGTLKSVQNEMVQSKKELATKDLSIQRARDELSLAHTRMAQESERASGAEQKLKQLQEELKCQRQNAESSRLQHQQRFKELEKQHQRDLTELQKERQCLEKQHQQEVNKLNQELQQARTLHNALQAQADKEAVREAEGAAVSLEQSRKRERALEEEGRRLAEERADALRLLKELQEQKAAPAPVQFCPVGQSFSPPPSHSLHSRPSSHIKRSNAATPAEQRREEEENVDKRRAEMSASYPSDREPGEGIDSEHITVIISTDSECLQTRGQRKKSNEEESKNRNETIESDTSDTNKHSTFDRAPSISDAGTPTNPSMNDEKTPPLESEQAKFFEDLKRENATLRSELHDAREELQKRLDDLEAQRRAEAEARTRLKQLSRKRASQSVEREEQDKEWRAQLESEKAEAERLRRAVAALEAQVERGRVEREKNEREEQEEAKNKAQEDRESEMIDLNIQLKNQLADVKAQLALEREERKREDEERSRVKNTDMDVKNELSIKLEELQAELEELKRSRKKDLVEEEKISVNNSPLTYLTLHDDELNSNMVRYDNKPLPSPEQHLLFCQSTNQRNMLVTQATADLIQEEQTVIEPEHSSLSDDGQAGRVASNLEDSKEHYLGGFSLSDHRTALSDVKKDEHAPSDLAKELEHLQKEKAKETARADQYQIKLEALQSQVTSQTKQLTLAFEKQSQHISGLLTELHEKETALLSQGEELQHYKQELDALKAEKEAEDKKRKEVLSVKEVEDGKQKEETQDEKLMEMSGLQTNQEKESAVTFFPTNSVAESDSIAQRDAVRRSLSAPNDITSLLQNVKRSENEGGDLEREVIRTTRSEEELETACQLQINLLEQQVVELQLKIRALSEVTQQQAEELAMWRLASQPAPTFDLPNTDNRSETEVQISAISRSQSNQKQADEMTHILPDIQVHVPYLGVQESPGNVTFIREDELLLSCSSNKLQGRMLFSRLLHSNVPEPKSLQPSKKIASLQEYNQDTAMIDKESEKENQEISIPHQSNTCQTQHREKRYNEVIQLSSEKMAQHVTKDLEKVSGPKQTKTAEHYLESPAAKADASNETTEINTTNDSSDRDVRTEMKSVSSQTEESLHPHSAPPASELCCASTQTEQQEEEEDEEELVESPPVSPVPLCEGAESGDKMLFSSSFPIPADPARLAERIRRNRTQLSAAFDDTEYEPYGLPEVVMKGFADIPSGPSCPYIVRR